VQQFVSFQQDLLVIGKSREEAILPFAGIYAVRAGCLLCMLGQTVPAKEFIPEGAGISRSYTLFPEIYFPFECKPVPQFLLLQAFSVQSFWLITQSKRHHGLLYLYKTVGYQDMIVKTHKWCLTRLSGK
jgi:hypothetical protein